MTDDFEEFVVDSQYHGETATNIEQYFVVDGEVPDRLRILRAESLNEDYCAVMSDLGISVDRLSRHNATQHESFETYMTPAVEEAIYNRYRWVFDQGLYSRLTFDA